MARTKGHSKRVCVRGHGRSPVRRSSRSGNCPRIVPLLGLTGELFQLLAFTFFLQLDVTLYFLRPPTAHKQSKVKTNLAAAQTSIHQSREVVVHEDDDSEDVALTCGPPRLSSPPRQSAVDPLPPSEQPLGVCATTGREHTTQIPVVQARQCRRGTRRNNPPTWNTTPASLHSTRLQWTDDTVNGEWTTALVIRVLSRTEPNASPRYLRAFSSSHCCIFMFFFISRFASFSSRFTRSSSVSTVISVCTAPPGTKASGEANSDPQRSFKQSKNGQNNAHSFVYLRRLVLAPPSLPS